MHGLVLEVEVYAPLERERERVQMRVGRPVSICLQPSDGIIGPGLEPSRFGAHEASPPAPAVQGRDPQP